MGLCRGLTTLLDKCPECCVIEVIDMSYGWTSGKRSKEKDDSYCRLVSRRSSHVYVWLTGIVLFCHQSKVDSVVAYQENILSSGTHSMR
jgi:hypothetical protein